MKKIYAMMIFVLMVFAIAPIGLAQQLSGSAQVNCVDDSGCDTGEFCDDGECEAVEDDEAECTVDADCEDGFFCDDDECEEIEDNDNSGSSGSSGGSVSDDDEEIEMEIEQPEDIDDEYACDPNTNYTETACTMEYAPVCGDDGVTYGNGCTACASGLIEEYELGECDEEDESECSVDADCEEGKLCDDGECEDEEDEEEETADEAKIMNYNLGAKIRMLQLEIAVTHAILRGEIVVDYIEETYPEENVTELDNILDSLSSVASKIQELKESEEGTVEDYVQLKKDSMDYIKDFRDAARVLLVYRTDIKNVMDLLKEGDYSSLDDLKEEKTSMIREHNSERIRERLSNMGVNNPELVKRIREGQVDVEDIKSRVREEFNKLQEEARERAKERIESAYEGAKQKREEAMEALKRETEELKKQRQEAREEHRDRLPVRGR